MSDELVISTPLLPTADAAKYLRISAHSLNQLRSANTGPAYIRMGRKVFYRIDDLDSYISSNKVQTGEIK